MPGGTPGLRRTGLSKAVERKRRVCERSEGQRQQGSFGVVAGDAVGFEGVAGGAAVDDGPFAGAEAGARGVVVVASDFEGDGGHGGFAGVGAVAWGFVDVPAVEAGGTVVAMLGAPSDAGDLEFAVNAGEAVRLVSALVIVF